MQIRVANRQDEPAIRHVVSALLSKHGRQLDLLGDDSDLNNIEANYFWYDGIFVVAEANDSIIGLLGARPAKDAAVLGVSRLAVAAGHPRHDVVRALLEVCIFFAGNGGYQKVSVRPGALYLEESDPISPFAASGASEWTATVNTRQH